MHAIRVIMQLHRIVVVPLSSELATNDGAIMDLSAVRFPLLMNISFCKESKEGHSWQVDMVEFAMMMRERLELRICNERENIDSPEQKGGTNNMQP